MRALIVCGVILLALFVIIPSLGVILMRVPDKIEHAVQQGLTDEDVKSEVDNEFSKMGKDLRKQYTKVYTAKEKMESLQPKLESDRAELVKEKQILERSRELLLSNKPGSNLVIGGVQYTWEQVQDDAENHRQYYESLKQVIKGDETSLSDYRQSYAYGNKVIDAALEKIKRERIQVDLDAVKLAAGRARQEARALSDDIRSASSIGFRDAGRYRRVLKERLREVEANDEFDRRAEAARASTVVWDKELGVSQDNIVDRISVTLGDKKSNVPLPAVSKP